MPLILCYMKSELSLKQASSSSTSAFGSDKQIETKIVFSPSYYNSLLDNQSQMAPGRICSQKMWVPGNRVRKPGILHLGSSGLYSLECEETKPLAAFQKLMANELNT